MTAVIRAESLSKRYSIGARQSQHDTLRDLVAARVRSPLTWKARGHTEQIWALRDVSFEVARGEVVGIIGRNGAGKSTLLKVLARITKPTEGRAEIYGRVGSLLEVGTGFHPELTGRQNVFLNGSILGMRREEIARLFDEIVEFAEIERFIDTPVKRYSSGMYVRLAFAVAAHLQPEILLVDEVLAVGDAGFQRKCLGKMDEVASGGRTILFVSHNMAAVENLCHRAIVLLEGRAAFEGATSEAVSFYLQAVGANPTQPVGQRVDRRGSGGLSVTAVYVRTSQDGQPSGIVRSGEDVEIVLEYETEPGFEAREPIVGIALYSEVGAMLTSVNNHLTGDAFSALGGRGAFVCRIPRLALAPATYRVDFSVRRSAGDWNYVDSLEDAARITVVEGDFYGTGVSPLPSTGFTLSDAAWYLDAVRTCVG